MSNSGLFERKHEDCEAHVLTTIKAEVQKLWDRMVVHVQHAMEARRYRDAEGRGPDPDGAPVTAEDLEKLIKRIAHEQEPGFRMGNYQEGEKSWKDWILGLVGLLIVAWLGRLSYQLDSLQALVAKQAVTDQRLDRLESKVYRGAP